jgi:microcin C transport system substrate-binding protein
VPQFQNRVNNFEFDLMPFGFVPFYPPSVALRGGWNSRYADRPGDENSQGIKDPVIDELVEMIIAANTYDEKAATCKAFDRYATWQFFSIGTYYDPFNRIAYWDMFGHPDTRPKNDVGFPSTWWFDGKNPKALRGQRR